MLNLESQQYPKDEYEMNVCLAEVCGLREYGSKKNNADPSLKNRHRSESHCDVLAISASLIARVVCVAAHTRTASFFIVLIASRTSTR